MNLRSIQLGEKGEFHEFSPNDFFKNAFHHGSPALVLPGCFSSLFKKGRKNSKEKAQQKAPSKGPGVAGRGSSGLAI